MPRAVSLVAVSFVTILALAAIAGTTPAAAAHAGKRIRLAQSGTVTACMMLCNSQAANCQTTCVVPGTAPTGAATTTGNANVSTSCQLNCSTQQIACQTNCAQTSPSQ